MDFLEELFSPCRLCPRECGVMRKMGQTGFCRADREILIAGIMLHPGEEPCISVGKGSGAVFFSLCNMACKYCQNYRFSQNPRGEIYTVSELSKEFLLLQEKGAANINLITPEPYLWQISQALKLARSNGLNLPVIYNSSAYVSTDALRAIDGLIDVYLLDLKYADNRLSKAFSMTPDYSDRAKEAIMCASDLKGEPELGAKGAIKKGLIIRHLVLPGHVENSKAVLDWVAEHIGDKAWLSLMSQFEPVFEAEEIGLYRPVSEAEYEDVLDYAFELGLCKGWFQPFGGDNNLLGDNLF